MLCRDMSSSSKQSLDEVTQYDYNIWHKPYSNTIQLTDISIIILAIIFVANIQENNTVDNKNNTAHCYTQSGIEHTMLKWQEIQITAVQGMLPTWKTDHFSP